MDSLTQACLGAAVGGAILGRRLGRKAVVAGAFLGTLPDLDVIIDYGDAVADYASHRGFSHSLWVLEALATLLALGCARGLRTYRIPFGHWWLFFSACLLTHPLLDAFTTYGTQLWWPLTSPPVSWASIFIIDPLYTLPLLITVLIALYRGRAPKALGWGLALSTAYLLFSLIAKQAIDARLEPLLAERGLADAPRLVQPTPFNTLLWRVTVIDNDRYHEALAGLFDTRPPPIESFPRGKRYADVALATASGQRLRWFAGPFLRYRPHQDDSGTWLVVTDLRLGLPGFYPFNFRVAERTDGSWQAISSQRVAGHQPDIAALFQLWQRAITPDQAVCPSSLAQRPPSPRAGDCPDS
ncbi:metal-dependent hydrolase [Halomonas shantousis]